MEAMAVIVAAVAPALVGGAAATTAAGVATTATALTTASTALSIAGTVFSGVAQMQQAKFQQAILNSQAEQAQLNAFAARERSAISAQDQDFAALNELEEQLARQGASGFDVGSGSLVLGRVGKRAQAKLDRTRIRQAGEQEALNFESQATGLLGQATLKGNQRFGLMLETGLGIGSSLITGATTVRKAAIERLRIREIGKIRT